MHRRLVAPRQTCQAAEVGLNNLMQVHDVRQRPAAEVAIGHVESGRDHRVGSTVVLRTRMVVLWLLDKKMRQGSNPGRTLEMSIDAKNS